MKGSALGLVEIIARVHNGQLEDGPLREFYGLLHHQPTLFDSSLQRVHALILGRPGLSSHHASFAVAPRAYFLSGRRGGVG